MKPNIFLANDRVTGFSEEALDLSFDGCPCFLFLLFAVVCQQAATFLNPDFCVGFMKLVLPSIPTNNMYCTDIVSLDTSF